MAAPFPDREPDGVATGTTLAPQVAVTVAVTSLERSSTTTISSTRWVFPARLALMELTMGPMVAASSRAGRQTDPVAVAFADARASAENSWWRK